MCHKLLGDARFYELQLKFDEDIAVEARASCCSRCSGRLDSSNYQRKPRGAMARLPDRYETRFSLCCAKCRRRSTPPSVRFLGRRVYLAAVVVLASAMQHGITPTRANKLQKLLGTSIQTLTRWREWWLCAFIESKFWKATRAFFSPPPCEKSLPLSLLESFGADEEKRLTLLLRFLKPISTPSGHIPDIHFEGV